MKRSFVQLLVLMLFAVITAHSQEVKPFALDFGDPAPSLRVREWLKGKPIDHFEKGTTYVVEFWATWCKPCRAMMPRLSELARKYKKKVVVIGVDIHEMRTTPIEKVKYFVDSMGRKMNYRVALGDSLFMETAWLTASGEMGIPRSFVVDAEGRLAWIGHPVHLHEVLPDILNNNWNINDALIRRNSDRYLRQLDDSLHFDLMQYTGKSVTTYGQPDSALLMIDEMVKKEPKLTYAPFMASSTFGYLLETNTHKAYEYGKQVLVTRTYEEPDYDAIIWAIEGSIDRITIPAEIYELGAEAYQVKIDEYKQYAELFNLFTDYNKMAEWYCRAGNKSKAIRAQKKAIKALKKYKNV